MNVFLFLISDPLTLYDGHLLNDLEDGYCIVCLDNDMTRDVRCVVLYSLWRCCGKGTFIRRYEPWEEDTCCHSKSTNGFEPANASMVTAL